MSRKTSPPLSIRSAFARERAHELARASGVTATEVVEDALRGYVPAGAVEQVGRLVRRGPLLVLPAGNDQQISLVESEAALSAARDPAA